jgi:sulfite reductase (NADPH) flavoprotein alpha-component
MKIKSFKRQLRNIHKIVGLLFCITIVIIGVTGALYSYSDVITNYEKESYLRARYKPNAEPLSLRELSERFYRQRPDADIRYIRGLTLGDNLKSLTFTTFNDGKYSFYHIDMYSGDIAEHSFIAERVFWAIVLLHTSLDFEAQNATGRHIVAATTIAIIVLTITGLYFYIPMLKHNFSRNMKLDLKAKGYGFWYKLHSVVGVYTCLFVLTMCLTGLWWSYDWYRDMLYDLA